MKELAGVTAAVAVGLLALVMIVGPISSPKTLAYKVAMRIYVGR